VVQRLDEPAAGLTEVLLVVPDLGEQAQGLGAQ
jgi:hypothetical protein